VKAVRKETIMAITKQKEWNECVEANKSSYGKACVDVARRVMEILDEESGDFDTHKILRRADKDVKAGGITGFMAGCVAQMVSQCHSRGEEFRKKWNCDNQIKDEGEKANESGGILNPAILEIR
jgi:hypothetical protein